MSAQPKGRWKLKFKINKNLPPPLPALLNNWVITNCYCICQTRLLFCGTSKTILSRTKRSPNGNWTGISILLSTIVLMLSQANKRVLSDTISSKLTSLSTVMHYMCWTEVHCSIKWFGHLFGSVTLNWNPFVLDMIILQRRNLSNGRVWRVFTLSPAHLYINSAGMVKPVIWMTGT